MRRTLIRRAVLPGLLAWGALLPSAEGADAQGPPGSPTDSRLGTGVGWTVALPEAFLGLGFFHRFGASPWGVFVDGKLTNEGRKRDPNFHADRTVATIEAEIPSFRREFLADWDDWTLFSVGVLRAVTPHFAILVGGGAARKLVIREYLDPSESTELSDRGVYFVEHEDESGVEPNAVLTALIRGGGSVAFSAGFELAPRSITVGAFYVFR